MAAPDVECFDAAEDGGEIFRCFCCVVAGFPVLTGVDSVAGFPVLSGVGVDCSFPGCSFSVFFMALPMIGVAGDSVPLFCI